MLKKLLQGSLIGLAAALLALLLWDSGALDRFEAKTWDWRVMRLAKPGAATGQIRLVFIDQYSLDWARKEMALKWPWPREVYNAILDFCRRQGARAVIFDMVYSEPSYMGVEDDRAFGAAIAETTGFVSTVFLGRDGASTNWPAAMPPPPEMRGLTNWLAATRQPDGLIFKRRSRRPTDLRIMPTATFPIPEIATNVDLLGNVRATPDADAIFRRLELFSVFDGRAVPSLALAAYLVATPGQTLSIAPGKLTIDATGLISRTQSVADQRANLQVQSDITGKKVVSGGLYITNDDLQQVTNEIITPQQSAQSKNEKTPRAAPLKLAFSNQPLTINPINHPPAAPMRSAIRNPQSAILHSVPIDRRGRALLNFRGPSGTHKRFTAAAVIQSDIRLQEGKGEAPPIADTDAFRDCYVFLGCNAPGLLDLRPAPVGRVYTGVEILATALDNLLSDDFMRDASPAFTILCVLVMALLAGILARLGRGARDDILVFVLTLPLPAVWCVAAYQRGFWLPFMAQESAVVFALVGAILVNYATEGKQKRFIRGAFKQYLSEDVIEQLIQHPERLKLGGEQRTLSIFFSDLQGFTTISEGLKPPELTALLNDYLTPMTDIIQEEDGYVDKYEGDAIIAFWNAPLAQADHAARAVRAALRCQARLAELRPEFRTRTGRDLFMRIGLNTGAVVVGNMGSHSRFNYTILGDAANLASRLEGINKQFGTYTLISETTRAVLAADFVGREISRVAVVGRKTAVAVFEPMDAGEYAARREIFDVFAQGLAAYYAGRFDEALRRFESLQEKDPPAAAYARKCRALLAQRPPAWDGVWVMTEK